MRLPPSYINLPLGISFPLHRRPNLDVIVWVNGVPDPARCPLLAIKVANVARAPVEVTCVYAGFIYESLPREVFFGNRSVKLPLRELKGKRQPPCVLRAGRVRPVDRELTSAH